RCCGALTLAGAAALSRSCHLLSEHPVTRTTLGKHRAAARGLVRRAPRLLLARGILAGRDGAIAATKHLGSATLCQGGTHASIAHRGFATLCQGRRGPHRVGRLQSWIRDPADKFLRLGRAHLAAEEILGAGRRPNSDAWILNSRSPYGSNRTDN